MLQAVLREVHFSREARESAGAWRANKELPPAVRKSNPIDHEQA